jgi:hypothetical protein
MDTLAFGYILPTTGRIPDFHRLETCAAGRTKKPPDFSDGFNHLRKMRLELTRDCSHKILSLARLPIPTLPHDKCYNTISS